MDLTDEHMTWAKRQARAVARRWPDVPVEDLEQEAAIITWRLMCDYDPARNDCWQAFAYRTVHSTLLRKCEQWHRWNTRNGGTVTSEPAATDPARQDDERVTQAANRLIGCLGPRHRAIVRARLWDEATFAEIAIVQRCTVQHVHQMWGEALAAMRAMNRYLRSPA